MSLLEVQAVTKKFGPKTVLENVHFSAGLGRIVGFVGPNGAGKSTLFDIICGCLMPTQGQVFWAGKAICAEGSKLKQQIGYMAEGGLQAADLSVRDQLLYGASLWQITELVEQRVSDVIAAFELGGFADKKLSQLSKGMACKVALAQAMLHEPKLLVLDEPTSGLDPWQVEAFQDLVTRQKQQRLTLISSHQLDQLSDICDDIIMLHHGCAKSLQQQVEYSAHMTLDFGDGSHAFWLKPYASLIQEPVEEMKGLQILRFAKDQEQRVQGFLAEALAHGCVLQHYQSNELGAQQLLCQMSRSMDEACK